MSIAPVNPIRLPLTTAAAIAAHLQAFVDGASQSALRDAGFDGFRVMLFQQKGGLKQATGEEAGLEMNPAFFMGLLRAIVAGDVINGMGYRMRPFEIEAGATDRALAKAKLWVHQ